jgi:hypothetical protein
MHPPRRKRILQGPQIVDQLAEWLLRHCPFTALALLVVVVAGSAIAIPRPLVFVTIVALADVTVNIVRARRQPRAAARPKLMRTNAPA